MRCGAHTEVGVGIEVVVILRFGRRGVDDEAEAGVGLLCGGLGGVDFHVFLDRVRDGRMGMKGDLIEMLQKSPGKGGILLSPFFSGVKEMHFIE